MLYFKNHARCFRDVRESLISPDREKVMAFLSIESLYMYMYVRKLAGINVAPITGRD